MDVLSVINACVNREKFAGDHVRKVALLAAGGASGLFLPHKAGAPSAHRTSLTASDAPGEEDEEGASNAAASSSDPAHHLVTDGNKYQAAVAVIWASPNTLERGPQPSATGGGMVCSVRFNTNEEADVKLTTSARGTSVSYGMGPPGGTEREFILPLYVLA